MNNAISCKVVLLGESGNLQLFYQTQTLKGVGKTSIISRYINNVFQSNSLPTDGASFATKNMYMPDQDKNIKFDVIITNIYLKIWDTAGQEKFRSLTKIFYKDAAVAILVYDITRKSSFEEVTNYWINQLKENALKNISQIF